MPSITLWGRATRLLRHHRGFSQADLAKRVKVTPSYISYLENGHRSPSVEVLDQICPALGVTISQFARIAEDPDRALGIGGSA